VNLGKVYGKHHFPRIDPSKNAGWGSAPTDASFSSALTPVEQRRVWAVIDVSLQLATQGGVVGANFIMSQIMSSLAAEIDRAAVNGSGADGEPVGILNHPDVTVDDDSEGIIAIFPRLNALERGIADNYGEFDELRMLAAPDVREQLKNTQAFSGSGSQWNEFLPGRKGATPHIPNGAAIVGAFNQLVLAYWGEVHVLWNPFSEDIEGMGRLTAWMPADVAVTRPKSFAAITGITG